MTARVLRIVAAGLLLCAAATAYALESKIDDELKPTPSDATVDGALRYLAGQQREDGSWNSGYGGPNAGVCSLALLAFMANGNTPERGTYSDVVAKGLNFILKLDKGNGLIEDRPANGPMYSHGISTIMLAEAYGMTKNEEVKKKLDAAIRLIIQSQKVPKDPNSKGGWRYQVNSSDSDISCSGWQLVALRAAKNCDLEVPKEAIDDAIGYIRRCAHPAGGFGYQPGGGPQQARTGTGTLALQLCGLYDDALVIKGADFLMQNPLKWESEFFYYALYHCSNAMFQAGDKYWEFWRQHIEKLLLEKQNPDKSWPPSPGDDNAKQAGPIYMTAMATLALSIQYRYLPIYQR